MSRDAIRKSVTWLRERFNELRYWENVQAGRWSRRRCREGHPAPIGSGHPTCTLSCIEHVYDEDGQRRAVIHFYLLPSGEVGGSGRPDPKAMWIDGEKYVADTELK